MELQINNKIYIGKYNENDELVIKLDNDSDKLFFKTWQDNQTDRKSNYVKDINVNQFISESGVLGNCFPILDKNLDSVMICYDFYKII